MTTVAAWCAQRLTLAAVIVVTMATSAGITQAAPYAPTPGPRPGASGPQAPRVQTVACSPRPQVIVSIQLALVFPAVIGLPGQDALDVTVTATGAGNSLQAIHITTTTNALVSAFDATAYAAPYDVTFPPDAEPIGFSFTLWRPAASLGSFARLIVTDACGDWPTFVGRGSRVR